MKQSSKLFGTDGIRGRVNEFPITAEVALRMGKAVANVLRSSGRSRNRVLIGKDTRISGYMLETAITSGLVSMGMDVYLVGPLPTPAVAHLTKSMGAAAGIMITASHNPYEDNGMKIFGPDGYKLSDDLESLIEGHILGDVPESAPLPPANIGKAHRIDDARGRYIEFAKNTADNLSLHGMKIVIDCGHGAAYFIAPLIFKELGAEVIVMANQPDGININDGCGALHPEAAGELVRKHNADLGISFDGDADRVIFTDANGQVVSGDRILGLCAVSLKEHGKLKHDTLVATVMSNLGLIEAMKKNGIHVETAAVGDRNVIECMRKNGYNFGGENSGHLIFGDHVTTGDGILSALQVLRMMIERKATLAQLAAIMHEYPTQLANLPVPAKPPLETLPKLQELMSQATAAFGESGRHLIRYSGTENKIRVLVEHRELSEVRAWTDRFTAAIREEIG
ncbi:phosphoglucosamine mutase [Luteolibacter yonseiensis]|uniref:Phosphoglucosamine mutase n=1 Tax=Luteolibacter yonseiensis TaxID=1144680 RepID=A0A934R7L8_9BACT|nr:phosphoglucosamine mutase [Luteolibacter yonseiensis]MBK1817666.1 phosphoglucosamine mutase [Luteolibacter yonseiensis]